MKKKNIVVKFSKPKLDGSLFKKAMVCRTGDFVGVNGDVSVTKEMLTNVAERYNRERANPQNENDYAPLLIDHNWDADNNKGRVMADMVVEQVDPSIFGEPEGTVIWGLFCTLRIDDEEAKKKVETGKYAHVSIAFDEDSFETMEISFVGVEAARRSIILSYKDPKKGDQKMKLQAKYAALQARQTKMLAALKAAKSAKGSSIKALKAAFKVQKAEVTTLSQQVEKVLTGFRAVALSAELRHLVRLGKMTPAELKEMNPQELAELPEKALVTVLKAYKDRKASTDMTQHGQSGATQVKLSGKDTAETRKLIKLQREGKTVALSAEDEEAKKLAASKAAAGSDNEQGSDQALSSEQLDGVVAEGKKVLEKLQELLGQVSAGEAELKKLAESDAEVEKLANENPEDDEDDEGDEE